MTDSAEIEAYLDELLGELGGEPAAVRRMLRESEQHLYEAADRHVAAGMDVAVAARLAVEDFGPARTVAATWNSAHTGPRTVLRGLAGRLVPVAAVGLVAIGLSGVVARAMTAIWGARFMFADPPGTRYSSANCSHWLSLHPQAGSCTNAYIAETMADGLLARYAAGVLGVLLIAAGVAVRRRHRPRASTAPTVDLLAAAVFAVAAAGLLAEALDSMRIAGGNGAGQALSGAIVAAPLAVVYGVRYVRAASREPLAVA